LANYWDHIVFIYENYIPISNIKISFYSSLTKLLILGSRQSAPLLEFHHPCYDGLPRSARWLRPVRRVRKVRTPSSTVPDNVRGGEICRIGPQKHTAPSGVRVKWWCKRPPAQAVMPAAGQPPSGARPNRDELLREGKLLVSLEFQVGCTEVC